MDPVTLGLTTQINLDFEVQRAAADRPAAVAAESGASLLPAEVSTARDEPDHAHEDAHGGREERIDADSVFAKLKGRHQDEDDED